MADIEHGAPVHVQGSTDIGAASAYSNHRSVAPHSDAILAEIFDDVRFGRSIIFPRSEAHTIPDFRLSPLAVVVSPSKTRIIHDLTFSSSQYARSVDADTDFAQPPPRTVGSRVAKYNRAHLVFASSLWAARTHSVKRTVGRSTRVCLLHLCEVVRPGKYFVRRMLNQVGLLPVRTWSAKYHAWHARAA